ncbi:MAG: hypothetical protein HC822_01200 [Oscillochloris sp.]|nr:hypothetical protein [Oscillochloris sp.]
MNLRKYVLCLAIATAALATLLASMPAAAQSNADRLIWSTIAGVPADIILEDVVMVGNDRAWVVGRSYDANGGGSAYRLTLVNGRWQVEQAGIFRAGLYDVAALDGERIWVVGEQGLIVQRDASGWREVPAPSDTIQLHAIQMLGDGSAGWAGGSEYGKPVMLAYRDGVWQRAPIETPFDGMAVSDLHLSGNGGWAVGSAIWRLENGNWKYEAPLRPCGEEYGCAGGLAGVRAIDGERAWAVGSWVGICAACSSNPYIVQRSADGWRNSFPRGFSGVIPEPPQYPDTSYLGAVYFSDADNGIAVGNRFYPGTAELFALRYRNGSWSYELIKPRSTASLTSVYFADPTRGLVVGAEGTLLSYGYGEQAPGGENPARPVADPKLPGVRYFAETAHTLRGTFLRYWENNGGLERFGYPLTEEFAEVNSADGKTYTVQYFERARFEYHPEYAGTQYEVLLGLLGNWVTEGRRGEQPFQPVADPRIPTGRYFPETGHTLAPEFLNYWQRNGGLPIYGYPISEPFYEVNAADGQRYLVQYFERNRFEYHPEYAGTPYEVLLGLLGNEYLQAQGWR